MTVDRIANMISSIKNASMAKKPSIEVMHSKECEAIAKVLKEAGFLTEIKVFKPEDTSVKRMRLDLKHDKYVYAVTNARTISKPGRRIYKSVFELRKVAGGFGVAVVSTSKGIMSGSQAKKKNLGGELICEVL